MDLEKLKRLQAMAGGGKVAGQRRKVTRKQGAGAAQDDKKLQAALKKINMVSINGIEEVNMFREDGNVLHFTAPKVHANQQANTTAIYGAGAVKELTELVPGILNQLGPDSLASLRKLAESYQAIQGGRLGGMGGPGGPGAPGAGKEGDDDDEVPDLVENFDAAGEEGEEEKSGGKLEELN